MKIINNTLYATSMVASCEALVYGVKAGLDPKTLLDVINVSSGRSFATLERIPQCVLDRSRSEERREGKECVSTCRFRWSPFHSQKNTFERLFIRLLQLNTLTTQ